MTRLEKIKAITEACVAANPEIAADTRGIPQSRLNVEYEEFLSVCKDFASQTEPNRRTFMGVAMAFDRLKKLSALAATFQDRDICLADVLLAIDNISSQYSVCADGRFTFLDIEKDGTTRLEWVKESNGNLAVIWNLRRDSIYDQEDPCIDFIYPLIEKTV